MKATWWRDDAYVACALEAFDEIDVGNKPFWVMATTLD